MQHQAQKRLSTTSVLIADENVHARNIIADVLRGAGFNNLIFARDGKASPVHIEPRHFARQAFLITLLNPKAIVFYMAFFPLFIDPATHKGTITFVAMAATIATLTAVYCLTLCAFAQAVAQKVRAHRRATRWLERLAGVFLIAFGIRLGTN